MSTHNQFFEINETIYRVFAMVEGWAERNDGSESIGKGPPSSPSRRDLLYTTLAC